MNTYTLHSKLMDLQGQTISDSEKENFFSQIFKILDLRNAGQISVAETAKQVRKLAWRIAEDLRIDGLALSSGSDKDLTENLPQILKA